MSITLTYRGSNKKTTSDTTLTLTYNGTIDVGKHVLLAIRFPSNQTISSVTDSVGNTYQVDVSPAGGAGNGNGQAWISCKVTTQITNTTVVTVTTSAAVANKVIQAHQMDGVKSSGWFGGNTTAYVPWSTTRSTNSASITPDTAGSLVLLLANSDAAETSLTPAAGYTAIPTPNGNGYENFTSPTAMMEGQYRDADGSSSYTPTMTGGLNWFCNCVAGWYRPAPSGTTYTKTGSIVSAGVVSGADATTHAETGAVASEGKMSAADVTEHAESGAVVSAGSVAAADAATINRAGTVVSSAVVSAADAAEHSETGSMVAGGVVSGARAGNEYAKPGQVIVGIDPAVIPVLGSVDTVTKNGILVDLDPPSGIDNVKEIQFNPTAQTYAVGMTVAVPQGDSGAILTTPVGDMTDTIWDVNRANDDGFFSSVKNSAGDKWFSTNVRIGGTSGTVEPGVAAANPADHGWNDGENLWAESSRNLINQDDGWQANHAYANQDCIIENNQLWRCIGGGTSNNVGSKPTFPLLSTGAANNTVSGDGDAAHGGSGDFLWSRIGEYLGVWAASTAFVPGIYNNAGGQPIYMFTPYITTPTHPDKLFVLVARLGGTLAVTTAEPSWNGATNNRALYRDGNGIVWIAGGSSLFGGSPTAHGGEQLVITSMKAPATDKIIKVTNIGTSNMQVVFADHRDMTDYWGAQGYDAAGVQVSNQTGDRFVRNPTDVDGTAANRFQFSNGTRKSSMYLRAGQSRYLIYSTSAQKWSEYVPSGASLSGVREINLGKKNILASAGVISGHDRPENLKTGSLVSEGKVSAAKTATLGKTGAVVAAGVVSGADVSEHAETGAVVAAGAMSGGDATSHAETGAVVSEGKVSGADAHEAVETGAVVSAAVLAGVSVKQQTGKEGSLVSSAALSGADVASHAETGALVSAGSLAGADAAEHTETGSVKSDAVVSGAGDAVRNKSGAVVSPASLSASDVAEHSEAGTISSEGKVSGADQTAHSETGAIVSNAALSGARQVVFTESGAVISAAALQGADIFIATKSGLIRADAVLSAFDAVEYVEIGTIVSPTVLKGVESHTGGKSGSISSAVILSGVVFHYVPPTAPSGTRKVVIRAKEGAILLSAGEDATLTSAEEEAHGLGSAQIYSS